MNFLTGCAPNQVGGAEEVCIKFRVCNN